MIWLKDFTKLDNSEILAVFHARKSPDVARFSRSDFSFETHQNFIKYLKYQDDKKYFMVYDDNDFIGVISYICIANGAAEFGIYKSPAASSVGRILMQKMLEFAKNELKLPRIRGRVLENNEKAIVLYEKFGFARIGHDGDIIHVEKQLD